MSHQSTHGLRACRHKVTEPSSCWKLTHDGVVKLLPLLEVSSGPHGQNLNGLPPRPESEVLPGSL